MVTQDKLLTADEFWQAYAGQRVELVEGVPVEKTPTSDLHGEIAGLITFYLIGHVLPGFELPLAKLFPAD